MTALADPLSAVLPLEDWREACRRHHLLVDAIGWMLAAALIAGLVGAVLAGTILMDRQAGLQEAVEDAIAIDLAALPPPPAVSAVAEAAPDAPMVNAPETPDPARETTDLPPAPQAMERLAEATPPPEALQPAALPDLPPDSLAPPPPPPEPQPKPETKPVPRPETPPEKATETAPEKPARPEATEQPKAKAAEKAAPAPAPSAPSKQAKAKSSAQGSGTVAINKGQLQSLKASWGNKIRKLIQRRGPGKKGIAGRAGSTVVALTVTRAGQLAAVSILESSGHPVLDAAAVAAVKAAGPFPQAPAELTDGRYSFALPIDFSR
jgi:protein TonB